MLNLDKLKNAQIDLNNIDPEEVLKLIIGNQRYIIIVLILISLFIAYRMFNDHHVKEAAIQTQLTQEQGKSDVIKTRDQAIKALNDYQSKFSKEMSVFDLITGMQNFGKSYKTTVLSYTPGQSNDYGNYNTITVHFQISSDDYKNMMLFLRAIETSEIPLKIDSWEGSESGDGVMSYTIGISAVHLHS